MYQNRTFMRLFFVILSLLAATALNAQTPRQPLCIVNGQAVDIDEMHDVQPEDIVSTEILPADEQTVARYGEQANYGVIIISLRYDTPARFGDGSQSYSSYIAGQVKWGELERVARCVLRFTVREDGSVAIDKDLESTDPRLRRKVLRAVAKAPRWQPAMKDGQPVPSSRVLRIQLPEGRPMPPERAVILL